MKYYVGQKLRFNDKYPPRATFKREVTIIELLTDDLIRMEWYDATDWSPIRITWAKKSVEEELEPIDTLKEYVEAKLKAHGYA